MAMPALEPVVDPAGDVERLGEEGMEPLDFDGVDIVRVTTELDGDDVLATIEVVGPLPRDLQSELIYRVGPREDMVLLLSASRTDEPGDKGEAGAFMTNQTGEPGRVTELVAVFGERAIQWIVSRTVLSGLACFEPMRAEMSHVTDDFDFVQDTAYAEAPCSTPPFPGADAPSMAGAAQTPFGPLVLMALVVAAVVRR